MRKSPKCTLQGAAKTYVTVVNFLHRDEPPTDSVVEYLFTVGNESQTSVLSNVTCTVAARTHTDISRLTTDTANFFSRYFVNFIHDTFNTVLYQHTPRFSHYLHLL